MPFSQHPCFGATKVKVRQRSLSTQARHRWTFEGNRFREVVEVFDGSKTLMAMTPHWVTSVDEGRTKSPAVDQGSPPGGVNAGRPQGISRNEEVVREVEKDRRGEGDGVHPVQSPAVALDHRAPVLGAQRALDR